MVVLLAHRASRDDRRCRAKYGPLWHAYCAHSQFRMFPFVY
jgi:delta14-sterol reductase